jgi:uncharacterized RDD family membrane protein YckC
MSEAIWYYLDAGVQAGPVDREAISELIASGRLPAGAPVWRVGMSGWEPWNSIAELASLAPIAGTSAGAGQPAPQRPVALPYGQPAYGQAAYGQPYFVYPKAPLGARFVASLVDRFLFLLPAIALIVAAVVVGESENENVAVAVVCGVLGGVLAIAAFLYALLKDGRANGQSIGKKLTNLMVVHLPTNQPCSMGQSAGRAAIMMVLGFIPYVGGLIEPIIVLAAQDGRRLGDKAANTQVISVDAYRQRHDVDAFS